MRPKSTALGFNSLSLAVSRLRTTHRVTLQNCRSTNRPQKTGDCPSHTCRIGPISYLQNPGSKEDPIQQEHWIEEELPEIKEEVQSDAGLLGYQDEASFQQAGSITRTWCVRGEGCDVKSYPTRKSIKVLGAVVFAKDPKWHFRFAEKFNGDSFLTLLKQMVRQYPDNRIHLITDNVRYHKGSGVRQWLEEQVDHIKPHFLPKYSPKLNAVEYIWRKIKRLTTHNRYFETLEELHAELFRRFNRFQGNPASLRSTVAGFT